MPWKDNIQSAREEYRKQQVKHSGMKRPQVKKKPSKFMVFIAGIFERTDPFFHMIKVNVSPYLHIVRGDLDTVKQRVSRKERTQEDDVRDQVKEIMRRMK
jgi:hypothetical protein